LTLGGRRCFAQMGNLFIEISRVNAKRLHTLVRPLLVEGSYGCFRMRSKN